MLFHLTVTPVAWIQLTLWCGAQARGRRLSPGPGSHTDIGTEADPDLDTNADPDADMGLILRSVLGSRLAAKVGYPILS